MIRSTKALWLVARFFMMACSLTVLAQTASASADEAAIRAQSKSWETAYNAGDAKGVTAQYAEDALLLPPASPAVNGRAAILTFFTKNVAESKAGGVVFVINPKTDVGVSGNMGWESGTYKATVNGAIVETGKFLSVSRKKDGKWQYIRDTWNSDAAPGPAAAPAGPAVSAGAKKSP